MARRVLGGLLLLLGLTCGLGVFTLHQADRARADLEAARSVVSTLEDHLRAGDTSDATALLRRIQARTRDARNLTSGPQWSLATHLPGRFGRVATLTRGLTGTLADISSHALPGLVAAAEDLRPDRLVADHRVDLQSVSAARSPVATATAVVSAAHRRVAALRTSGVGQLDQARRLLLDQLTKVQGTLAGSGDALTVLPPMLGGSGPRKYFLAFQNPAEQRATGGYVGAFGILTVDQGRIALTKKGTDSELTFAPGAGDLVPVDLGAGTADFESLWDPSQSRALWITSNYTTNFPYAAAIWRAKYAHQTGTPPVDGAIALDPIGIGQLLGPRTVTLSDGEVVAGPDFATFVTQTLQTRFATGDQSERKQLLLDASQKAFDTLLAGGSGPELLAALQSAAGGGHVQVWSAHPDEETILAKGVIAGQLPQGPGPFAWLGIDNISGNKGDVFLRRSFTYRTGPCPAKGTTDRDSTITATLTNLTPVGAPPIQSGDFEDQDHPVFLNRGHARAIIVTTQGSGLEDATVTVGAGPPREIGVETGTERGHPVYIADLVLPQGVPVTLTLKVDEPAADRRQTFRPQPFVQPQEDSGMVLQCD